MNKRQHPFLFLMDYEIKSFLYNSPEPVEERMQSISRNSGGWEEPARN